MKLSYYADVTPLDYEPPHFQSQVLVGSGDDDTRSNDGLPDMEHIHISTITTPFHGIGFSYVASYLICCSFSKEHVLWRVRGGGASGSTHRACAAKIAPKLFRAYLMHWLGFRADPIVQTPIGPHPVYSE